MSYTPGMTPEVADAARDVLALVRASIENDHDAIVALLGPLDLDDTRKRLISMSGLLAVMLRSAYGDEAVEETRIFAQKYLY